MKSKLILAVMALFVCVAAQAQTGMKIGYADVDYILSQLPEASTVPSGL